MSFKFNPFTGNFDVAESQSTSTDSVDVFTVIQVLRVSGIFEIIDSATAYIKEGGVSDKVTIINTATVSGSGQFTIGATATVEVIG